VAEPTATDAPATEPMATDATVAVTDSSPARVRRPLDLIRLTGLVCVVALLTGFGALASDTTSGANADLSRLLGHVPRVLVHLLSLAGAFGVLAVPLGYLVSEVIRGQTRRLIEALVTGVIAIGVVRGLDLIVTLNPSSALYDALTLVGKAGTVRPLDAYLAALLALLTITGAVHDRLWGRLLISVLALYVVSAFAATQASLLSLLSSLFVGVTVGVAVRYFAGTLNERPDGERIAASLRQRNIDLIALVRIQGHDQDHREYLGTTREGKQLAIQVLDRDLVAYGAFYSIYRLIRVRAEISRAPALSLERLAERRSLLSFALMAAEVPVPRLEAGVPCGADTIVLVYEYIDGVALNQLPGGPTPDQLTELWADVEKMHQSRIAHRGLTASAIVADSTGRIVLPIPTLGSAFASDLRLSLDRAQLLVSTTLVVGAPAAVLGARAVLNADELASTLPLLQPIALNRETRAGLRHDGALLDALRDEIQGQTDLPSAELSRVERVRPRTVITIVAAIVAVYLLVGQLGSVDLTTIFKAARWRWVPLVVLASIATYFAAALALTGYVRERLSFLRTVAVQVAASFAGFVTPPAVGGLAVNIRYLRKANISPAGAATSVGMCQVVNAASHVLLLIVFAAAAGVSSPHAVPIPGWAFIVIAGLAAALLIALTVPFARRWLTARLLPPLREALPRLLNLATSPLKLSQAIVGSVALNGAYIAALWCAMRAFGGTVPFASVAVVYLAGAAIASAAPTPGGLGAIEIALSTGLAAGGMSSAAAISAVLLFRLATFWLPVPAGWVAFHFLQVRNAL
jgi:uncharacterized membrane protein YbhN (UPF0104 family)